METIKISVEIENTGMRLDKFLSVQYPDFCSRAGSFSDRQGIRCSGQ